MSIADEWREATNAEELRGVWTARSREETKPDKRPRLTPAEKKEEFTKEKEETTRSTDAPPSPSQMLISPCNKK
ncbi:hypothetical protein YC2023_051195 [Brassica napus]